MNLLDFLITIVFVLFILHGYHKGFLISVMGIASFFVSWLAAVLFSPLVSTKINNIDGLTRAMLYYTEGAEKLASVDLAKLNVETVSPEQLTEIVNTANLTPPLDDLVSSNIAGQAFKSLPEPIINVGDYFNQTIVNFAINVVSFLIVFLLVRLALAFIIGAADSMYKVSRLKQFDSLMGAGLGIINGFFAIFVVFMLVPIVLTVLPFPFVTDFINNSFAGAFFYNANFLLSLIRGVI